MTSREAEYRPHLAQALEHIATAQLSLERARLELCMVNEFRAGSPPWEFPELEKAQIAVELTRREVAERLPIGRIR